MASVVYFIRHQNRIKVGFTKRIDQRSRVFRALLLGDMEIIGTVPGARNTERFIHEHLRPHWIEGEWFKDCDEVRAAIDGFLANPPDVSEKPKPPPSFVDFCRKEWPRNRISSYMEVTGCKRETAKRRTAGKHPPDYEEIAAILRSEYGFKFLQHIMGDARPAWFASVTKAKDIGALRRQVAEQQRRLTQMEMGLE